MKRLLLAVLLMSPCALSAQPSDCSDGVKYDDGIFETGVGFQTFASRGEYVMRIDPPERPRGAGDGRLEAVCICWTRGGSDSSIFFNIRVWDSSGPGGGPGALLGTLSTVQASAVSSAQDKFYRYDLSSLNIAVGSSIYIGPEWDPGDDENFFVCMDESVTTPKQPAYISSSILGTAPTSQLGVVGLFPTYRALGIRAKFGESTSACVPGPSRLCLNQGRFAVEATFTAPGQSPGTASVVKLTDETGYLWFFNSSNVEAVVKVLNGCGLNGKFWVFAGGLTDVQVTLTVTDTQTGNSKTYTNPQGTAFRPIQDTVALACQ
ncbi:MAG TPA: hypothetical protein VJ725_04390 [Thermoanaerobaculia bacterium]|nr:hypothetical protein [Thermoanaerobaculia bacterium]